MKKLLQDSWVQLCALTLALSGLLTVHDVVAPPYPLRGMFRVPFGAASLFSKARIGLGGPRRSGGKGGSLVVDAFSKDPEAGNLDLAVESAADGDTLFVRPGSYRLGASLGRSLSIIGDGGSLDEVIIQGEPERALAVTSGVVLVKNLTVVHRGPAGTAAFSVSRSTLHLVGVAVRASTGAVGVLVDHGHLIAEDSIFRSGLKGVSMLGGTARLVRTAFSSNRDGLSVEGGAKAEVSDSVFTDNENALLADSGQIVDSGSSLRQSREAAILATGKSSLLLNLTRAEDSAKSAIRLQGGSTAAASRIAVSRSGGAGVVVGRDSELHLSQSEITGSGKCGIEIDWGSAYLDDVGLRSNHCGVAFLGDGLLQSNNSRFVGNGKGPLLYSDDHKSGIFLHGTGNTPADFQELFR